MDAKIIPGSAGALSWTAAATVGLAAFTSHQHPLGRPLSRSGHDAA